MANTTGISWCDSTFNPWIGCTKISPACDNCYAERDFDKRRHAVTWGHGQPRHRTSVTNWKQVERWDAKSFYECASCGWRGENKCDDEGVDVCPHCDAMVEKDRRRVFCASLADVFDNEVQIEWFVDLLDIIRKTPNLDWLLLTKRIGNWQKRLIAARNFVAEQLSAGNPETDALFDFIDLWFLGDAPSNVWLGATVCNQAEADRDIPNLLSVPASVRFLSIEPMLGKIDLTVLGADKPNQIDALMGVMRSNWPLSLDPSPPEYFPGLDWVICGGESGPKARPMHPDWVRSLRDQCAEAGTAFFFKQWGAFANQEAASLDNNTCYESSHIGGWIKPDGLYSLGEESKPTSKSARHVFRLGAKAAGRQLDGREHNEFPEE